MKNFIQLLETYLMVLVHPFRIHHQFKHNVALPGQNGHIYPPLTLAESLGISWLFAILRGLFKIIILNVFLVSFLNFQSERFPILQDFILSSGISAYYFLLFSAALDVIFFPIGALIVTEAWSWIIRRFSKWLNPETKAESIADQITVHALSAHVFYLVPYIGDMIQSITYFFLLYAGLRSNFGASRSLAWVILLSPFLAGFMLLSILFLVFFYLGSAMNA